MTNITIMINGVAYEATDLVEIAEAFGVDAAAAMNMFVEEVSKRAPEDNDADNAVASDPYAATEKLITDMRNSVDFDASKQVKNKAFFGPKHYVPGSFVEDARTWRQMTDVNYLYRVKDLAVCSHLIDLRDECDHYVFVRVHTFTLGNMTYAYYQNQKGKMVLGPCTHTSIAMNAKDLITDMNWVDPRLENEVIITDRCFIA